MSESPYFGKPERPAGPRFTLCLLISVLLALAGCGGTAGSQSGISPSNAVLVASPSQIDFGSVSPNSGASQALVLTNRSASPLTISSILLTPADAFSFTGWNGPVVLQPHQSLALQVKFTPRVEGVYAAAISVASQSAALATGAKFVETSGNLRQRSSTPSPHNLIFVSSVAVAGRSSRARGGSHASITISPSSSVLQAGGSEQFQATVTGSSNPSVTWNAALGTITSAGLYSAPKVAITTEDTVSATLAGGQSYDQATVTVQPLPVSVGSCTTLGKFSTTNPPPACWVPYGPSSPFNRPVPANPKLDANSSYEIARLMVGPSGQSAVPNFGSSPYSVAESTGDYGHPVYFATAKDPVYKITSCYYNDGTTVGMTLHMPVTTRPSGGSDGHTSVVDQTTGIEFDFYDGNDGVNGTKTGLRDGPPAPSNNDCNGSCTDLPAMRGCGHYSLTGTGLDIPTTTAAGYGLIAGQMRAQDFQAGTMSHAITALIDCTHGYVYPSGAPGLDCVAAGDYRGDTYALPMGAHLWLDYTDDQINALNLKPWEKTLVTAIAHYGIYLVDTSGLYGNDGITMQFESGESYFMSGVSQPMTGVAAANGIPQSTWPDGSHYYRFTPNGVNIDWAHHLHVLDPCVAKGTC